MLELNLKLLAVFRTRHSSEFGIMQTLNIHGEEREPRISIKSTFRKETTQFHNELIDFGN